MPDVNVSKHRMMTAKSATCAVCEEPVPAIPDTGYVSPQQRHLCPLHQDYTLVVYDVTPKQRITPSADVT
jgi:hypothetical protein